MTSATHSSPSPRSSHTDTIVRNSAWYGLELLTSTFAALFVSIVVGNAFGPLRLGYYTYMMMLTNVAVTVGAFGLPMTTRKFMAEHLSRGERGVAHGIYRTSRRLQTSIAVGLTIVSLFLVFTVGDPEQHVISLLLVLNIGPRMIGFIPSQANNAAEQLRRNTVPAVLSSCVTLGLTLVCLWGGWGLPGVAASLLAGTVLETGLKLHAVHQWLGDASPVPPPQQLRRQMFVYSGQGLALMLLNIVVWDRSDIFFLARLNPDLRQVTFFSYAFNWTDKLLMAPNAFAAALGVTQMAQAGRRMDTLKALTVEGARYTFLIALPLLAGLACVGGSVVSMVLTGQYQPMIPVLVITSLLAIPKALAGPPTMLLQATENQGVLVTWGCVCGAACVTLDILLIRRYGAIGAALANGTAQTLAALGIWVYAHRVFSLDLRLKTFGRIIVAGVGLALAAVAIGRTLPAPSNLVVAVPIAALVWLVLLRWTGALDGTDGVRFMKVGLSLPNWVRPTWNVLVAFVVPTVKTPHDVETSTIAR